MGLIKCSIILNSKQSTRQEHSFLVENTKKTTCTHYAVLTLYIQTTLGGPHSSTIHKNKSSERWHWLAVLNDITLYSKSDKFTLHFILYLAEKFDSVNLRKWLHIWHVVNYSRILEYFTYGIYIVYKVHRCTLSCS